jgi:uncharacterized protein YcfL
MRSLLLAALLLTGCESQYQILQDTEVTVMDLQTGQIIVGKIRAGAVFRTRTVQAVQAVTPQQEIRPNLLTDHQQRDMVVTCAE